MRRLVVLALLTFAACDLSDSPTSPGVDAPAVPPRYSFGGGAGKVLASTNQGELVEIDLDLGIVTLIGDVGTFGGDQLGWTDIAADDSGRPFAISRIFTETEFEVHLYEIDPSTGAAMTIEDN